ncbi:multicopper oxidase-domain-containing protein [Lasiosphaeria miniovina]|uniref:Multicopper oxidase-domain-containing protein n=1 Tax=Lasiosphaeria miniovina TaxID=1954250 RepID=A0AA40AU09_9PEZI|nr:multicopper oxidase-domain-containing protein [Lasiosphaeria miniovina]KAK0721904.1 multicopper oxidase-domain-containing protein [Lasiosphaeria miniovina]
MQLLGRIWKVVTSFLGIAGLESALKAADQIPLGVPAFPEYHAPTPLRPLPGPIFKPPGGIPSGDGSDFQCDYSKMVGFKECSSSTDRSCWLTDGTTTWDINTNYEEVDEAASTPSMPIGVTRTYQLVATDSPIVADGLDFPEGKVFDGGSGPQYPGPWIQACWGDTIEITVINKLKGNGTTIHWHGLRQWFTMHMDGVNGLTQCPIAPSSSFVYRFNATQYGSSWYHSHYSIQYADGLVGPISIHGPTSEPYDIAPDLPLLLTDWAHNSAFNVVSSGVMENPSILLNGRGNASAWDNTDPKGFDPSKVQIYTLTFQRNQTNPEQTQKHLIRVINTSFDTTFTFTIDGHQMTVVEVDFVPINGFPADGPTTSITVGIGQRYNIIVESLPRPSGASGDSDSYWIRTYIPPNCTNRMVPSGPGYMLNGILRYSNESTSAPTSDAWPGVAAKPCVNDPVTFEPVVKWNVGPPSNNGSIGETRQVNTTKTTVTNFTVGRLGLWAVDTDRSQPLRINFSDPSFFNQNQSRPWKPEEVVLVEDWKNIGPTDWIYITITNFQGFGPHPMHLHGHDFAILNISYTPPIPGQDVILNTNNPPRRDVVLVPTGGFVVIAFRADNPGNWLMHCHIAQHAAEGLGLQILERPEKALQIWPPGQSQALNNTQKLCAAWTAWQSNCANWAVPCADIFQDDSGV